MPASTVADLPAELAQHGKYRVQELLDVGGIGAVYKAEHLLMERPVALKVINHSLTSNRAMIERFRREVKTAGQLKHPNIVMAYDAEQGGSIFDASSTSEIDASDTMEAWMQFLRKSTRSVA